VTEPEGTDRYRGPLPGEVPLSRDARAGGPLPGLTFDDVTGRVIRTEPEPAPEEESAVPPAVPHVPEPGVPRAQRRSEGTAMVPLLARALSAQLAALAAADDPAPDGWWFTPDR
jgi:hypothetical protein